MSDTLNSPERPALLRLAAEDNVLIAIRNIAAGSVFHIGDRVVTARTKLPLGHKIAARDIAVGEKIVKYGVPIGSATAPIAAGEHVHLHNLGSDYLPTFTHASQDRFFHGDER